MQLSVFQSKPWEPQDFIMIQKQKDILEKLKIDLLEILFL